jgi:hypothetical protein
MSTDKSEPKYKAGQRVRFRNRNLRVWENTMGDTVAAVNSVEWNGARYVYSLHAIGGQSFSEDDIELATKSKSAAAGGK